MRKFYGMTELEQLTEACRNLGAEPAQAGIMAQQMLKRADQLAVQRGMPRVEAMSYLLKLVVSGRAGQTPSGFEPTQPPAE